MWATPFPWGGSRQGLARAGRWQRASGAQRDPQAPPQASATTPSSPSAGSAIACRNRTSRHGRGTAAGRVVVDPVPPDDGDAEAAQTDEPGGETRDVRFREERCRPHPPRPCGPLGAREPRCTALAETWWGLWLSAAGPRRRHRARDRPTPDGSAPLIAGRPGPPRRRNPPNDGPRRGARGAAVVRPRTHGSCPTISAALGGVRLLARCRGSAHPVGVLPDPEPSLGCTSGRATRGTLRSPRRAHSSGCASDSTPGCRRPASRTGWRTKRPTPWRTQPGPRAHAPTPHHAALRPTWVGPGRSGPPQRGNRSSPPTLDLVNVRGHIPQLLRGGDDEILDD